jgi:hypothetical protein
VVVDGIGDGDGSSAKVRLDRHIFVSIVTSLASSPLIAAQE